MNHNTMKPAARKIREDKTPDLRIAATLDDIASALEKIEDHLANLVNQR